MIPFIWLDDPVYSVIKFMEANSRGFQALRRVNGGELVFGGYNISGGGWCGWLQWGVNVHRPQNCSLPSDYTIHFMFCISTMPNKNKITCIHL